MINHIPHVISGCHIRFTKIYIARLDSSDIPTQKQLMCLFDRVIMFTHKLIILSNVRDV